MRIHEGAGGVRVASAIVGCKPGRRCLEAAGTGFGFISFVGAELCVSPVTNISSCRCWISCHVCNEHLARKRKHGYNTSRSFLCVFFIANTCTNHIRCFELQK